jgi:hypothetical protein
MAHPTQTGQLLVSAGMVSQDELNAALVFSDELGVPIGQMLIMCGNLDPRHLDSVLCAQSLIRKQSIDLDMGVCLLKEAHQTMLPVEQLLERSLLERSGCTQNEFTKELGQFLVAATLINHATLSTAMLDAGKCRQSITRYLLEKNLVSAFDLFNTLQCLTAVRLGGIRRDSAVKALRVTVATGKSYELALNNLGLCCVADDQSIQLGRLLCSAGLIGEIELCEFIEIALTIEVCSSPAASSAVNASPITEFTQNAPISKTMLAKILLDRGIVRPDVLESAFAVQWLIEDGSIDYQLACELLQAVQSGYGTLQHCCVQLKAFSTAVLSLLVDAKLVTEMLAKQILLSHALDMPAVLVSNGYIDDFANKTARRFQEMVNKGLLKREKAVAALHQLYAPREPELYLRRSA